MLVVHDTVALCEPDGGLTTWKIIVRIEAVVPVSVPGIRVPGMPPKLAEILVAVFALITTMIIAARLTPLPMTNAGVVILVTPHWKPDLTALSYKTTPEPNGAVTVNVVPRVTLL
jgi:hypothetical protein